MLKYYTKATAFPSLITLILILVLSIVHNHDYKSEWFTAEGNISFDVILTLALCIIYALLCLPVFLLKNEEISKNKATVLILWFLFPTLYFCFFVFIAFKVDLQQEIILLYYYLAWTVPFAIGLLLAHKKYKKDKKLS